MLESRPAVLAALADEPGLVQCRAATRSYDGTVAIDDLSLAIAAGEFVWLVGPSGSGKSTLLRMMAGQLAPTGGRVTAAGLDLGTARRRARWRGKVGFVHQDHGLLADRTAAENVAFALEPKGWKAKLVRERVRTLLTAVGLTDFADRYPRQLSGGECQRVAVARAMAPMPAMLACDEPTGNLDPANAALILDLLIGAANGGTTVLIASHDAGLVDRFRARVVQLEAGRLVRDDVRGRYQTNVPAPPRPIDRLAPNALFAVDQLATPWLRVAGDR